MQFLPVAERELRVAARKRATFRMRMLTSAFALVVAGFSLWLVTLFGSRPVSGSSLFFTLSWVSFICACLAGPALTADCVNEERNYGTLGLLFLTDLNGVSIALGKLMGHGLQAVYSIVAIVPVMALPVLIGGADAVALAQTALVLFTTVILSLILGMFASTVCRRTWMAAAVALFEVAILVLGIPIASTLLRENQRGELAAGLELLSPSYSLLMAGSSSAMLFSNRFGLALALQMLLALSFFGAVALLLPQLWKEGRSGAGARYFASGWRALKYGSGEARRRLRTRLLHINPVLWLSSRERFGPMGFALLLLALAFAIFWTGQQVRAGPGPTSLFIGPMAAWIVGVPLLYVAFCFRLALAASERFAVDRRAGALELIVCTPLQTREIIRGHWLGLVRRLWGAAILLFALHAFALNYIVEAIRMETGLHQFGCGEVWVGAVRHLLGVGLIPNEFAPFYIACLAVMTAAILIVILWIALGWLGMALSLILKREIFAPWISLFLLAVPPIPLFILSVVFLDDKKLFASNLFVGMLRFGASGFLIVLGNALLWLFVARRWTYGKLRTSAV